MSYAGVRTKYSTCPSDVVDYLSENTEIKSGFKNTIFTWLEIESISTKKIDHLLILSDDF